jgi:hypothetical protein
MKCNEIKEKLTKKNQIKEKKDQKPCFSPWVASQAALV